MSTPKLKLWPIVGINVFNLPEQIRHLFPHDSANEEDCIPIHEQTPAQRQSQHIKPHCTESADANVVSLF